MMGYRPELDPRIFPQHVIAPPPQPQPAQGGSMAMVPHSSTCEHKRTTMKGTNKYYTLKTCLDCKAVLMREPKPQDEPVKSSGAKPTPSASPQSSCQHRNVSWKGTNGYQ